MRTVWSIDYVPVFHGKKNSEYQPCECVTCNEHAPLQNKHRRIAKKTAAHVVIVTRQGERHELAMYLYVDSSLR